MSAHDARSQSVQCDRCGRVQRNRVGDYSYEGCYWCDYLYGRYWYRRRRRDAP